MAVAGMGRDILLGVEERARRTGFPGEEHRSDLVGVEGNALAEGGNGLVGEGGSDPVAGRRIAVLGREADDSLGEEDLREGPGEVLAVRILRMEVLDIWLVLMTRLWGMSLNGYNLRLGG
jgi:hypothetical protein